MSRQSQDQFRIQGGFGFHSPGGSGQVDVRLYRGLYPDLHRFTKASNHQRDPDEHADGYGQGGDGKGSGLQSCCQTLQAVSQSKSTRFDAATDLLDQERREKGEGHQNRYRQHKAGRLPALPQKPEPESGQHQNKPAYPKDGQSQRVGLFMQGKSGEQRCTVPAADIDGGK